MAFLEYTYFIKHFHFISSKIFSFRVSPKIPRFEIRTFRWGSSVPTVACAIKFETKTSY